MINCKLVGVDDIYSEYHGMSWILLVDDDPVVAKVNKSILEKKYGYRVEVALSGNEAVEKASNDCLLLMDVNLGYKDMPEKCKDGIDVVKFIKKKRDMDVSVIYITGKLRDDELIKRASETAPYAVMDKPLDYKDLQITIKTAIISQEKEIKRTIELREMNKITMYALYKVMEKMDPYTAAHQVRVKELARAIAKELNQPKAVVDNIRRAAPVHDFGKIFTPISLLIKPANLAPEEMDIIRDHVIDGYKVFKDINENVAKIILQHHERLDGSGYPNGLKGENIKMESKIIAVADVVEAMASPRPYRLKGLGIDVALAEIEKNANPKTGAQLFDPDVVAACLRLFREKDYKMEFTYKYW